MAKTAKSTQLYPHPFSKSYWRDAAAELKDTKMLVVTALMIALRVALKPLAIPLGPQLSIQTAMLATALGAMIFGPVVAIPAAMISDTIGFMIYPTGDYFLPFMLTEIASTMFYALCLYRAKVTPTRVMISRFLICFLVNVVLQQLIYAWWYVYIGNPEKAMDTVMGVLTMSRVVKNGFMFPLETVALTVFLQALLPIVRRAGLVYCSDEDMKFTPKRIVVLVLLTALGIAFAVTYLTNRYQTTSRSADFTAEQRVEENHAAAELVLEKTDDWDDETVVCVVDSAYCPLFGKEMDYTVSVYILDEEAFAAGQAADAKYTMDTLWGYSKSGPSKDAYGSLVKVATVTYTQVNETGEVTDWELVHQMEEENS